MGAGRRWGPVTGRGTKVLGLVLTLTSGLGLMAASASAQGSLVVDAGRGPLSVFLPAGHDPDEPVSLLLVLHGYASSGAEMEAGFDWQTPADLHGLAYLFPEGTVDPLGARFWNGTDACCDFLGSGVDDVAYLRALIEAVQAELLVDPRRVHVFGHSAGGFMAHRFACDAPDVVASVASSAGMSWLDPTACVPSEPVHVLEIHGELDPLVPASGGALSKPLPMAPFPSALASVQSWATRAGCLLVSDITLPPIDVDASLEGAETGIIRYITDCDPRGSAELWTVMGGGHVIDPSPIFVRLLFDWFAAHPQVGTWEELGTGIAGVQGTPSLAGAGALLGDDGWELLLTGAAPLAPTWLVVGFAEGLVPFKGGVLVPGLDEHTLLLPFLTDDSGALSLNEHWPLGLPSGFAVWFQAWTVDGAALQGLASSQGLLATTP
jgi:polyhydroxybutyrate depolymerase